MAGNSASGFLMNAIEEEAIESRIASIEADIGPIEVVVYNLGAQIGDRSLADTSYKAFEMGWKMATFGLFRAASRTRFGAFLARTLFAKRNISKSMYFRVRGVPIQQQKLHL